MIPSWSRQIPFVVGGLCILLFNSITAAAQARQLTGLAAPLVFEQNKGQVSANYEFLARRNGVEAFYFSDGMDVFVPQSQSMFARLRLTWRGAKAGAVISGEEELPGRSNYFRGPDISRWVTGIRQFGRIRYPQIYPGVDL